MDYNLAYTAIGYGAMRVLRERNFSTAPYASPARHILTTSDPVAFCLEALSREDPACAARADQDTRAAILAHLSHEAEREHRAH